MTSAGGPAGPARPDDDLLARAEAWLADDPDPGTRDELRALIDAADVEELADRFGGRLQFGTAGLRGALGAGPRRMNRLVVRQAAAGLGHHLGAGSRVVIGYDARHKSRQFAEDSACVLAAAGCRAALLPQPGPTPLLAFAIRHLCADAGVMVTASHNPARDNGYKVYLGDGAQIVPPVDREIAKAIEAVSASGVVDLAPLDDPSIERLGHDVEEAYLAFATSTVPPGPREVTMVYTPLHGVGGRLALAAFDGAGFPAPSVVDEQFEPDPDFPTVAFPNPEEPGALDLAIDLAHRIDADVVIANDPDADRLGIAVPEEGEWRRLTGDEIGVLLADAVLAATEGDDRLVVTTIVSSPLLAELAEEAGVHFAETLTGFKWVVRPGLSRPDQRFVFGYEEALGYSVAEYVRDKDGITAGLAFAGLVARLRAEGRTVIDRLTDLARRHGYHASRTWSVRDDRPGGADRLSEVMDRLRRRPPEVLGDSPVRAVHDLLREGPLPPTDAVRLDLDDARVIVRPSGTEPKLKCYFDLVVRLSDGERPYAASRRAADARIEVLRSALASALDLGTS